MILINLKFSLKVNNKTFRNKAIKGKDIINNTTNKLDNKIITKKLIYENI